jgi:hypothetical protein
MSNQHRGVSLNSTPVQPRPKPQSSDQILRQIGIKKPTEKLGVYSHYTDDESFRRLFNDTYRSVPKRKIKKSKTKTRSQHAKKVSTHKMKKVSTRKAHSQHAKKVRKTRKDKGVKRGPRKA